jgi:Tetratricopeptide repeat
MPLGTPNEASARKRVAAHFSFSVLRSGWLDFLAFVLLFFGVSSKSVAQQAPQPQMGAPATDISNLPQPIDDTMDQLRLRDMRKDASADKKNPQANDTCLLPPLNRVHSPVISATALAVPEKAQYEYFEACEALSKKKVDVAEKHLRKAVQLAPKYPAAWVTLGQMLAAQNHTADAQSACFAASTAEPNYVPALLCLAELAAWGSSWNEVLQYSERAIQLDPVSTPIPYEFKADANLRINKLDEAETSALRAAEVDKNNTDPRVHFLLAQVYEAKHDRANEIIQLKQYLQYIKDGKAAEEIKGYLAQLEHVDEVQEASAAQTQTESGGAGAEEVSAETRNDRGSEKKGEQPVEASTAEADESTPPACNLDDVLPQIEQRVRDFVDNVHRFTATQSLQYETASGSGKVIRSGQGKYDYTVAIAESTPGMLQVKEYETSRSSSASASSDIVSRGLPALLLIFHPYFAGDFAMRCEARTSINGEAVLQIRFRQRRDRPSRMRSYSVGTAGKAYPLDLEGRAWFTASTYQVVKLEAGLAHPIPEIQLTMDRTVAEYGPVYFQSRRISIWLPQTVELTSERKGKRFHERITFNDYLLFAVDDKQLFAAPKNKQFLPQPFMNAKTIVAYMY